MRWFYVYRLDSFNSCFFFIYKNAVVIYVKNKSKIKSVWCVFQTISYFIAILNRKLRQGNSNTTQPPKWTLKVPDNKRQTTEYDWNLLKQWEGYYQFLRTGSHASDQWLIIILLTWTTRTRCSSLVWASSCGAVRMRGPRSISFPSGRQSASDSEPAAARSVTLLLMHARG